MNLLAAPKANTQAQQQPAYTSIATQTSTQGKAIQIVYGTTRIAPNLIWYGDFNSQQITTTSGGGGGKGAGTTGESTSTTYLYSTSIQLGLCEGPIGSIVTTYKDKQVTSGLSWFSGQDASATYYDGSYTQAPWPYLVSNHPDQALNYHGIAHLDLAALRLGKSNNLYQFNFEVNAIFSSSVSRKQDADPSLVIADLLSNAHYGAGFPSSRIGDLSVYQDYTLAAGLLVSFKIDSQTSANGILQEIATATNSEFVWSAGTLTMVPYGDTTITGNGKTYTAPSAPLYDLNDDDFIITSAGADPVQMSRKRPSDANNSIKIEYLDSSNAYNVAIAEAKDQAAIDLYGLRQNTTSNTHLFCEDDAAQLSAQLQLQRQAVRNQYTFNTDQRYIVLDPMDIITITDPGLGLDHQWVRVLEIAENSDWTLTFTVEEYLAGTGHAPLYSFQANSGYVVDYNGAPGNVNTPVIFEAPVQIATTSGLEVWIAASGGADWGGCNVYVSTDDDNYKYAGEIVGPSRQGVLTANLGSMPDPDTSDTLSVNLSESGGALLSGSQTDADQGHTLCYVDGELIAYQTATLTSANHYDLTYLRRGMYGSPIGAHSSTTQFARLDGGIFVYPYDKSQIGQTFYIKFLSFNIYGAAAQGLADVSPYTHVIAGPPKPSDVMNFIAVQNGNSVVFTWTDIIDYALKGYDIGYADEGETDWNQFILLTEATKGTEMTNASVPAGTWTFGIRAKDIADQLSPDIATFDLVVINNDDTTTIQKQEPDWAGTMSGFIRHWTGVLVPDSTTLANHTSDFTVFDTFVPDPVASAYYITPTYDIGYINNLRIHSLYGLTEGPGQSGSPSALTYLDAWTTGADPATYVLWTVGTVPVRYLNMKITYAPVAGQVAYLSDFAYTVDRSPQIEQMDSQVIAGGGTTVTFPQPFHDIPFVMATPVSSSGLYATAASITTTDCILHVWDHTGTDVGGTVTWTATGI